MEGQEAPLLLRAEEAARLLSISRSRVYDLIKDGTIPSIKLPGLSVRVPRGELEA
jgi:excisionase family DNA binding protein